MHSRYRPRRWLRWGLIYCAGVLALMVIGLVIEAALGKTPPDTSGPPPPGVPAAQGTGNPSPALTGPVQVVQGRDLVNGVYLRFPHSAIGAVSAAAEFVTAIGSTLDPDRAAAVMRMAADPSYSRAPQDGAEGAVNDRKDLGLPASGPVPPDASMQVEPVEYQVRDVSPDQVTVLLLSNIITTVPDQGMVTKDGVVPVRMHWAELDWKILPYATDRYARLAAAPDSPQSAALGWQELTAPGGE